MYLVAAVPIVAYYYICYLKKGKKTEVYKVVFWSIFFSIAFLAIQWILGILLPLVLGLILMVFIDNPIRKIARRTVIFFYFVISSQLFWLTPFIVSILYKGDSNLGEKISSQNFLDSFSQTVTGTATSNIIYPLLTFYHRQIAFDYEWHLKNVFSNYFDYVMPLSIIFILVLFLGLVKYNQVLNNDKKQIFIFFFASFIFILYFSTVNISFLKDIFLLLGHVPGFAIFRNFTDKFALSYIFIYSSLFALCIYVIKKRYGKFHKLIIFATIIVVVINFFPVRQILNSPLWKTRNVYTTVNFPKEYVHFAENTKRTIPDTTNIIVFPQNITSYSIITEDNGKNAYIGTSPFKYLTGVNDLTGLTSYPLYISIEVKKLIIGRNYEGLLKLLSQINTGYAMVINNIPEEVYDSYLFEEKYLEFQDQKLIDAISEKEIVKSNNGNYVVFKLRNSPSVISSTADFSFKKHNQIKYEITLKGLKGEHELIFRETYHPGWKLFVTKKDQQKWFYLFRNPVFETSHKQAKVYGNKWTISEKEIKINLDKDDYKLNSDGSIEVEFDLYFFPQSYFYIGIIMSAFFLFTGGFYFFRKTKNKKNN